jgi:hypothetical protein
MFTLQAAKKLLESNTLLSKDEIETISVADSLHQLLQIELRLCKKYGTKPILRQLCLQHKTSTNSSSSLVIRKITTRTKINHYGTSEESGEEFAWTEKKSTSYLHCIMSNCPALPYNRYYTSVSRRSGPI